MVFAEKWSKNSGVSTGHLAQNSGVSTGHLTQNVVKSGFLTQNVVKSVLTQNVRKSDLFG